ncbi:hypothetical protein ACNO7T_22905 [Vibrio campbellii]
MNTKNNASLDPEAIYAKGFEFYNAMELEEAAKVFGIAYAMDMFSVKYGKAFALTNFYLGEYEVAENVFNLLYFLESGSERLDFQCYKAICRSKLGDNSELEEAYSYRESLSPEASRMVEKEYTYYE